MECFKRLEMMSLSSSGKNGEMFFLLVVVYRSWDEILPNLILVYNKP